MVNTSLKPLTNHLKSILNNKKDGRNSSILFIFSSNCQQVVEFMQSKRKLSISTMITKNHADFIIAVIGNSIKREGERQKHPRYIIVSRMFRFLSPTKLNRYEQAVYSEAHTIQPLCLAGVRNLFLTPALRL